MRKIKICTGEYYHIYNRGNDKKNIFIDEKDRIRFLFLILFNQFSVKSNNLSRSVGYFVKHRVFNISEEDIASMLDKRYVELVCFALMPNHFHIILHEIRENGIAHYMQRTLNGYTKYFNTKYEKSGHLFQGPYQAVHVNNDAQLLYLTTYIHRNPRELKEWRDKENDFYWSSITDYIHLNRWGSGLSHQIVTEQFNSPEEYRKFVNTSSAKLETELNEDNLL